MRDYKKMPQAAGVAGLAQITDLDLPYNVISGDSAGGYSLAQVPYGAENGGMHGTPFTTDVTLARAGRT